MITYSRPHPSQQTMISFAQNREDVLIDRVFRKTGGFFIDVGAYHPVADSMTKYFNLSGWRGINIEPVPHCFAEFVRDRPRDINLPCAVGRTRGTATFHIFPSPAMSTMSAAQLALLDPAIRVGEQRVQVEVRTLADICAEFVTGTIDFLKIDAEGAEGDIIAGADWQRFRPRLLVIEATKPWSSELNCAGWEPQLLGQDYLFAYFDGINRYYLRREDEALAEQFSVPVNVLDAYIPHAELQLRQQLKALEDAIHRKPPGITLAP
jgi:FkbM family methyltransferase